ncbi:MAG TPA: molybdopterin biosynthesis protein [Desulfobacteraceae bacterium]|nr:molybdopterin biosynthesis protein [Desulfobacteraceae bacterium]HPJ68410.1 molybdopterin biosynthesis protein [Desulfobacteraceae bacterium]HPQ27242.1 molybdopterin biosynthesis protein [Desulfobacteraceae bacterium]
MKRQVYLSMKSLEEAREIFFNKINPDRKTGIETISTKEALGYFTAEPVFAKLSSPPFHSAAMDGVAVLAEKTYGTTERNPMILKLGTDAVWINTGQPLPEEFNSVIMVEKIHQKDDDFLEIRSPAYPWQNVRKVGEDIIASQLLLPQNHLIRPFDLGALICAGIFSVRVHLRPKVAIIPTGSELINHEHIVETGELKKRRIIEYNSVILAGLVRECNSIPFVYDIVPDVEEDIHNTLKKAVESEVDVVIINAGSSAGSKDFTAHIISEMGEVLVHGVAMMPGKPTILGIIKGKPIIGNPGYPVSATLSFDQFVKPLLFRLQGAYAPKRESVKVQPTRDIPSKLGTEEFLRVNIGKVGSGYVATPLSRAAGSITTLTKAEGLIRIPSTSEGISQEELIEAELLVSEEELLNTVVVIGSHDITIDILADEIRHKGHNIRISSSNVGSLGGLMALRKGMCHIAGTHLLDTENDQYNISFIKKYLKGMTVSIFNLVLRDQGLIIAKGNPKNIRGIEDLARDDVVFVNRQAGSGTRLLFDYRLNKLDIKSESITGYKNEEFTHMAVAVDVLSGSVDCGMGIFAAAKALNLDFIPMEREQYDIVIPTSMLDQMNIQTVLETIRSKHFKERVISLGGYDPSNSGDLWIEIQV